MDLPHQLPVMTLRNATLFPQALLPLYIFEPRYRQMLRDSLHSHRTICVAMQKPGRVREIPSAIACAGLIRAAVRFPDGTSNVILQGLSRVQLGKSVQYRPYHVRQVRTLPTTGEHTVAVDALSAKVLELVEERLECGFPIAENLTAHVKQVVGVDSDAVSLLSFKNLIQHFANIENPDHLADLVSCTLLARPGDRQLILETADIENRLQRLVRFLIADNRRAQKNGG